MLGLWAALIVLSASPTRPHNFLGYPVSRRGVLVGLLLVGLVAVTLAVAIGLALSRLPSRPRVAYVSLALSAAVVVLLAVSVGRRPLPPGPKASDPGVPGAAADETWR